MKNVESYTVAELELMLEKHKEGRVILPDNFINPIKEEIENRKTKIVREFSAYGPCLTLGKLVGRTKKFYAYDEWKGGKRYEGRRRVLQRSTHIEPCPSCRDHPKTQYPNGYDN
jgi:hypothetical protein